MLQRKKIKWYYSSPWYLYFSTILHKSLGYKHWQYFRQVNTLIWFIKLHVVYNPGTICVGADQRFDLNWIRDHFKHVKEVLHTSMSTSCDLTYLQTFMACASWMLNLSHWYHCHWRRLRFLERVKVHILSWYFSLLYCILWYYIIWHVQYYIVSYGTIL